jgi:hypothetical protein
MDNERMDDERPDEATVLASVQRVEPRVLSELHVARRRRRGLTIGVTVLAGVGLFAGGVAVGAAALPPVANPGVHPGVSVDGQGRVLQNQFAIDCYTSTSGHGGMSEMDDAVEPGQPPSQAELFDERYPTAECDSMLMQSEISNAVSAEVRKLFTRGILKGYITDSAGRVYQFESSGPATASGGPTSMSIEQGPVPVPAGAQVVATIPSPVKFEGPMAVCEVASNWVKVYPRGTRSAAAVCASVGLPVWTGP